MDITTALTGACVSRRPCCFRNNDRVPAGCSTGMKRIALHTRSKVPHQTEDAQLGTHTQHSLCHKVVYQLWNRQGLRDNTLPSGFRITLALHC
jgi:hypothetical protein